MNVQYSNAILNAIKHVFATMLGISVQFENPITKENRHPTYDVSCIMGLTGAMTGCIILSFPDKIAQKVASSIIEEDVKHMDEDLIDAICEVTNMVTGYADSELQIENLHYSLPSVMIEKGKVAYPSNIFIFSMPCITEFGRFEVDIALSEVNQED